MKRRLSLLKFEMKNIREYENGSCSLSFMNSQRVYDDVDSDSSVARIGGTVYDGKIMAICGINASGKTSLLSIISFMLCVYFGNQKINESRALLSRLHDSRTINIDVVFCDGERIFRIESAIEKDGADFHFTDEALYELKWSGILSRSMVYDDSCYVLKQRRSELGQEISTFLEKDKSIASMVVGRDDDSLIADLSRSTDPDIHDLENVMPEVVRYLDSSIERISLNRKNMTYVLKRKGRQPEEVTYHGLRRVLSSGTWRGICFFCYVTSVLERGGYLLVDELEDSFNKTIVMNIIEFFMRRSTNPHDAHLVFTTHYQELVDILDRNDSITITSRTAEDSLAVHNLSQYLKRNDVRRSEYLSSDYYDLGTAIDYSAYDCLRKGVEKAVAVEMPAK